MAQNVSSRCGPGLRKTEGGADAVEHRRLLVALWHERGELGPRLFWGLSSSAIPAASLSASASGQ